MRAFDYIHIWEKLLTPDIVALLTQIHEFKGEQNLFIEAKSDLTFETVLSSKYKMDILRKSKAEGYFIKCVFVLTADPELNVARVESRVMQGGHDVDREKVKTRFYKSLANIKELMSLCDILHVYDNTDTPYRIIRKHKDSITIFPNEYWDEEDIIALITGTYSQRYIG